MVLGWLRTLHMLNFVGTRVWSKPHARNESTRLSVGRSCTTPSIRRARAAKRVMGKIRKWKGPARDKPFSQTTIDKGNKLSLEKKMQIRAERAAVQAAQRAIDEDRRAEARAAREEREAREARKKENKEKGQQYQVITNTSKIKKMSKKQLRNIKKADTSGVAPKQYGKKVDASLK